MATNKTEAEKGTRQEESAINVTTGNLIARDASSGRFFVVKKSDPVHSTSPSLDRKKGTNKKSKAGGGLTINKSKAEKAEKAVLAYLNESKN